MTKTPKTLRETLDALAAGAEQRWGETSLFTFCECPDCQYTVVVASADLAGGAKIACTICWLDCRHQIVMTERPATDADKPEGPDARYAPLRPFTCAACGHECLSSTNEAEAQAEFEEIYHQPFDPKKHPPICDDCHRLRMKARGR